MASLEEQLKAVKLKKSDKPMKDFSSAKTAGFLKEEEIKGTIYTLVNVYIDLLVFTRIAGTS